MSEMIAIIPARGGSKRIPGKNIKPFLGFPVIEYSIRAALTSGCFSRVLVSTDSEEIAVVSRNAGAEVPFMRSAETSDDFATTADVVREVLGRLADSEYRCDSFAVIYATAPFVTADTLRKGAAELTAGRAAAFTCVEYSYPVQRSLVVRDGKVSMANPEYLNARSQDLEKHYHDAGQCYFSTVEAFEKCGSLWGPDTAPILLSDLETQDIDTPTDWKLAEIKYRMLHPEGPEWASESLRGEGLRALPETIGAFTLHPYQDMSEEMNELIRQGRNLPEVRERMVNRNEISAEEHRMFVESLQGTPDKGYYAVTYSFSEDAEPELLGSVTLTDMGHGDVERGIWLFPTYQGNGYARTLLTQLYDKLGELGYKRVWTRIRVDNEPSIALDTYLGATEKHAEELPDRMRPVDPDMLYFCHEL